MIFWKGFLEAAFIAEKVSSNTLWQTLGDSALTFKYFASSSVF